MSMGSTGTVNMTAKMISDIKAAVEEYRSKTNSLAESLDGEVNGLIPANFSGAAADGFKLFYTNNITPVIGENLTSLLDTIDEIAQGILDGIPGASGIDDQLGEGNQQ